MSGQFLAAIVAATIGSLATFLVAARRLSGRVGTTDAEKLWAEAGHLREE